jgi:hypothetical protein
MPGARIVVLLIRVTDAENHGPLHQNCMQMSYGTLRGMVLTRKEEGRNYVGDPGRGGVDQEDPCIKACRKVGEQRILGSTSKNGESLGPSPTSGGYKTIGAEIADSNHENAAHREPAFLAISSADG